MAHLLDLVHGLPAAAGYAVAALLVFAETGLILGLVLPGEATLLLVGFLSYAGPMRLVPALLIMVGAALAGDSVGWLEGRRVGARLRSGRLGARVGDQRWERAERLLSRHGGRAVAVARFIAFARTLTPRLAGMSRLPYRQFLPWNLLGVLGCVGGSIMIGYLAGTSYQRIAGLFGRATGALFLLLVLIGALVLVGRYLGRHQAPVTDFGARLVSAPPLRWLRGSYASAFRRLTDRFGMPGAIVVNLVLGSAILLGVGAGLGWLTGHLVRQSGLPLIDPLIEAWVAGLRQPAAMHAALVTLSVLRSSYVIVAVGVVGTVFTWRDARHEPTARLSTLVSAGLFIPLLVLAAAADWSLPTGAVRVFPGQVTLATAGFGMLAWMLARRLPWAGAVAVWMVAIALVVLVCAARVYLRWDWPSEVFAAVLLGALWALVFTVAWRTRDRVRRGQVRPGPDPEEILTGNRPGQTGKR